MDNVQRNNYFHELFNKYSEDLFEILTINGFKILKCNHIKDVYNFCAAMAEKKSKQTVNHGQDYLPRPYHKQFINAFAGIYAETYCHFAILKYANINPEHILQFDLVRPSWEYPSTWNPPVNEYDLQITINKNDFLSIEVKSSTNSFSTYFFTDRCHLIGGHINNINEKTDINDYYMQVYFEGKKDSNIGFSFQEFENSEINMYLISGISNKELYTRGFVGTLRAKGKDYKSNNSQRIADFVYEHFDDIQSFVINEDQNGLYNYFNSNKNIINEPLYIQIVNKDADNIFELCSKLKVAYSGLLFQDFYNYNSKFFKK